MSHLLALVYRGEAQKPHPEEDCLQTPIRTPKFQNVS